MHSYNQFVALYERLLLDGKTYKLGGIAPRPKPNFARDAPTVLIFAPHPDDECIIGGLPIRLLRESRMRVINVAVTQGSKKERQAERYEELKRACEFMGYELVQTAPTGLEGVNVKTRQQSPAAWSQSVRIIADILQRTSPKIVFFPHDQDWNSTHIGTHFLVFDALQTLGQTFQSYTVETEFWGANTRPNLMAESSAEDVADLVAGTSFHAGEVTRNPFHLFLPAWMQDNVRRGSELVGGQGEAAPNFTFATLYRMRRWMNGGFMDVLPKGRAVSIQDNPAALFA